MQIFRAAVDRIAWRRRVFALPGMRRLRRRSVDRRIGRFTVPSMQGRAREIVDGLLQSGIVAVSPGDFESLLGDSQKQALASLVERIQSGWRWNGPSLHLDREAVAKSFPAVFSIGLSEGLLDLADSYLGQKCSYLTCALTLEAANGLQGGTRNWHTDVEDDKMLRVLVYLDDVGQGGGGFEHFSAADTQTIVQGLKYRSGYISDDSINHLGVFEREVETGPAGTAVIFDGIRVIHRAGVPVTSDRLSLTLTYTSCYPLWRKRTTYLEGPTRRTIEAGLTVRQRAALI